MKTTTILLVLIVSILLAGCSNDKTCDDQTRAIRHTYGPPEEAKVYDENDYAMMTWWYWSQGIQYVFEWGDEFDGCQITRYDFTPARSSEPTAAAKGNAMSAKTMTEQSFCPGTKAPTR